MFVSALICAVLFHLGCAQYAEPVEVLNCSYNISSFVRHENYLRKKGDCLQGYKCDNYEIKPLRNPCRANTFFSVYTGDCRWNSEYAYIFGYFNCTAEEKDPNLDFEKLKEKHDRLCNTQRMQSNTSHVTEWYVGDPDNCRNIFVCKLDAVDDVWLYVCPLQLKFQEGEAGSCALDIGRCSFRHIPPYL